MDATVRTTSSACSGIGEAETSLIRTGWTNTYGEGLHPTTTIAHYAPPLRAPCSPFTRSLGTRGGPRAMWPMSRQPMQRVQPTGQLDRHRGGGG
jgi:hypothetical protein